MLIRSATTDETDDSFDVVYQELDTQQCLKMIPALYSKSHNILVGAGDNPTTSVQEVVGAGAGRLMGEDTLLAACSQEVFQNSNGTVVFRIFSPRNDEVTLLPPTDCVCEPATEEQTIGCPATQVGSIRQTRSGTCTGGTPACPDLSWGAWTTVSNTCMTPPTSPPPAPPVLPPASSCSPYTVNRTEACPAGQTGQRVVQDNYTCTPPLPNGSPALATTVLLSNTCAPPPPVVTTCTPSTQTRYVACPAGQGGQIIEEQSSSCPTATSTPVWGAWVETSRTCTATCITAGNCCTPGRDNQTTSTACAAGTYGGPISTGQERTSTCANATATPVWGAWYDVSTAGTCTSCPAPTNETQTRWVGNSAACPAGQTGSHVWEEEQIATRNVSYSCPAGTTSLPAPTYGTWGAWGNTGARRNEVNSCTPTTTTCTALVPWNTPTSGIYDEPPWALYQVTLGGDTVNYSCDGWANDVCDAPTDAWLAARGYGISNTRVPVGNPNYAAGGTRVWGMPNFYLLSGQTCNPADGFSARGLNRPCGVGNPCNDFEYGWNCAEPRSWVVDATAWGPGSGLRSEGWSWNYADYGGTPSSGNYFCQQLGNGNWNCGPGALSNLTTAQRYAMIDSNLGPFAAPPSMCTIGDTYTYSLNQGAGAGNVEGYDTHVCRSGCPTPPASCAWAVASSSSSPFGVGTTWWRYDYPGGSLQCTDNGGSYNCAGDYNGVIPASLAGIPAADVWKFQHCDGQAPPLSLGSPGATATYHGQCSGGDITDYSWEVPATCTPSACSGNPDETQWVARTGVCPAGQTGTRSWEQEQERSRVCTSGTWSAWGMWADTANTRNQVNTCAPVASCPTGYVPSGAYEWRWEETSTTTDPCYGLPTLTTNGACSAAELGQGWNGGQNFDSCEGGYVSRGPYVCHQVCVPATCTGSPTDLQWVPRSAACPVGQTGSNTWEAEQVRTRVCTAGAWGAYGSWSDTGATRNASNTCAPPSGGTMCNSGTMGNDILSPANWWCPGYNTSTSDFPLSRPVIFGADDVYVANVTDDPKVSWDDPAGGGVITGWVTMPKASWQGCGMPGASDMIPAIGQYFHASIYPMRTTTPLPAECRSSGNYVVVSNSCAAETPYVVPDLDTQARAACNGAANGSWTANLHHFPSPSIGCYTTVECR